MNQYKPRCNSAACLDPIYLISALALANDFAPELRPQRVDNDAPIMQRNVNQKMIQHICRSSGAEQPERAPRLLIRNLASLRPSRYDMEQKYKPHCSSVACFGLIWCSNA